MRRFALGLTWGVLAVCPIAVSALAGDGPPPLTRPVLTPPVAEPPAELPPPTEAKPIPDNRPIEAKPIPDNRPILVIPGVTTPRPGTRSRVDARPVMPAPTPTITPPPDHTQPSTAVVPPLLGPAGMPRNSTSPPRIPESRGTSGRTNPPLTLESVPAPLDDRERRTDKPGAASAGPRPLDDDSLDPPPSRSVPPPSPARRQSGLFGRMIPPMAGERNMAENRDRVRVEPRSDPATDAALKRRIERQITESLGSRVRAYEVRVVGRDVVIRARPARFWQRRAVRTTLESLPAISGYKATILVDD